SKYYGKTMAYTFASELLDYSKVNKFIIHEEIQCFLNRRISNNIWKIYFSDESNIFIRKSEENGKISHEFIYSEFSDSNTDFNVLFS
ncbi:TPA: DUF1132 family protein, partial [Neisseria meningitidis]